MNGAKKQDDQGTQGAQRIQAEQREGGALQSSSGARSVQAVHSRPSVRRARSFHFHVFYVFLGVVSDPLEQNRGRRVPRTHSPQEMVMSDSKDKGASEPPQPEEKRSGRVGYDERGNSVWEWQLET